MSGGVTVVSPGAPTAALIWSCSRGLTSSTVAGAPPATSALPKLRAWLVRRASPWAWPGPERAEGWAGLLRQWRLAKYFL